MDDGTTAAGWALLAAALLLIGAGTVLLVGWFLPDELHRLLKGERRPAPDEVRDPFGPFATGLTTMTAAYFPPPAEQPEQPPRPPRGRHRRQTR